MRALSGASLYNKSRARTLSLHQEFAGSWTGPGRGGREGPCTHLGLGLNLDHTVAPGPAHGGSWEKKVAFTANVCRGAFGPSAAAVNPSSLASRWPGTRLSCAAVSTPPGSILPFRAQTYSQTSGHPPALQTPPSALAPGPHLLPARPLTRPVPFSLAQGAALRVSPFAAPA